MPRSRKRCVYDGIMPQKVRSGPGYALPVEVSGSDQPAVDAEFEAISALIGRLFRRASPARGVVSEGPGQPTCAYGETQLAGCQLAKSKNGA